MKNKKHNLVSLSTDYDMGEIPHNYYPRPQLKRDSFINLNGQWSFKVLKGEKVLYNGIITLPFAPESALSGVERITRKNETLVYSRTVYFNKTEECTILNFGASDNITKVFINGKYAGENRGGYLPFSFDITDYINDGENEITVTVTDSLDKIYPYGKQRHRRGGMWYTPISGIWQTVWIENVPKNHIVSIKTDVTLNSVTIRTDGGEKEKLLILEGKEYSFTDSITVAISSPRLWTPEKPNIYKFSIVCGKDRVGSYFALREIRSEKGCITLNGKPYFFNGLLDQGYYPDGIFTPANENAFKDDILRMKDLGFNMLRKHIKIEPEIFYYYCDIYGMAVFQDMVNNGHYSFIYDTALPTVGLKKLPRRENKKTRRVFYDTAKKTIELLYNHPSIVYYTIFNEGWGQHNADKAYEALKPLDNSRIFDTASGWFKNKKSDVQSEHVYFKKADFKIGDKPCILSEFGGYSLNIKGHVFNKSKVYGYKICATAENLTDELIKLYETEIIPLIEKGLCGAVLTQLSDVEDETNGILTYDRRIIKPDSKRIAALNKKLYEKFEEKQNAKNNSI